MTRVTIDIALETKFALGYARDGGRHRTKLGVELNPTLKDSAHRAKILKTWAKRRGRRRHGDRLTGQS